MLSVRRASEGDEALLRALFEEFEAEVPEPAGFEPQGWAEEWSALRAALAAGTVYVAEDGRGALGVLHAAATPLRRLHVERVYVRAFARREGVARALLERLVADAPALGVEVVSLEVLASNRLAREVWERFGFEPVELLLCQPLELLARRLAGPAAGAAEAAAPPG